MTVRARFKVDSITRVLSTRPVVRADGGRAWERCELHTVVMSAARNCAIITGRMEVGIVDADAAGMFTLGGQYDVAFSPAEIDHGP